MSLTSCPIEIIEYIAEFLLSDPRRLGALVGACRYTYTVLRHYLYRSITCESDTAGALCCRTLLESEELAKLVRSFSVYGPDHLHGEENREFIRNLAKALRSMPSLVSLNCDVGYCSLEVCIVLSTGHFDNLEYLALRFTDRSIPISRSVHQLQDLKPRLPNLRRLLIRDNTQPSHAQIFIQYFIDYRRSALSDVMFSCWYDSGNKFLLVPCDAPEWSSLTDLTIRRDAFSPATMSLVPSVRRLTLLRDLRPMPPLPAHILPRLEHIGCAAFNLSAFLPKGDRTKGRPISSVTLDGISATGAYHGPRNQPTRTSLRNALSQLAFSSKPIDFLGFPIRMLYAEYFSDVSPYLQEATSLIVHIVIRADVQTSERRNATRGTPMRELGERIVQQLPCLKTLLMPNAIIPCKNDPPAASEEEKMSRHKSILSEWSTYCPTLKRVSLGKEYLWEMKEEGWRRVDALYERDDHELRYFDY
ncbi:hypothetical protein BDY19DRAFT_906984 [Irpex rosettiformis]|uniref:Uncharacterized protein n=1 Tax=Irpex rosettiformis TaxID=378272 RepID=A0ACB8U115_9APHY|nr:hypothetical protein BDY19DRAFT_906984 [Irpex rosettiformis]